MIKEIFIQDYKGKAWLPLSEQNTSETEDREITFYPILDYSATLNRNCLMVWDSISKRFSEVDRGEKNKVITTEGKEITGIFIHGKGLSDNGEYRLPVKWVIEQKHVGDNVTVSVDIAKLEFDRRFFLLKDGIKIIRPSISWEKTGWKINLAEGSFHSMKKSADEMDAPLAVTNALLRVLLDDAENHFGGRPVPRCEVTGMEKIRAFVDRPFDLNIAFARNYQKRFFEGDFNRGNFPRQNFRLLCIQMGIFQTEWLENLYYREPYAVHYRWALKFAGFKDEKVIIALMSRRDFWDIAYRYHARNFQLSENGKHETEDGNRQEHDGGIRQEEIDALLNGETVDEPVLVLDRTAGGENMETGNKLGAGIYNDRYIYKGPNESSISELRKDTVPYNLAKDNFADCVWLRYYYTLYTSLRSEWELAHQLLDGMGNGWKVWQRDLLRLVYYYRRYITGRSLVVLLNNGFTLDSYEMVAREICENILKDAVVRHPLQYKQELVQYEGNVGGYEFHLVRYTEDFRVIERALFWIKNDFQRLIHEGRANYFVVNDTGDEQDVGIIEIRDDRVSLARGRSGGYMSDAMIKACSYWAKLNGIDTRVGQLVINGNGNFEETYSITPPTGRNICDTRSLQGVLSTSKNNQGYYYYRHFGDALKDFKGRMPYFRFSPEDFENEYQYLKASMPFGECRVKDAFEGNPVAQNGIGCEYNRGYYVEHNEEKAIEWFLKSAEQGYESAYNNLGDIAYDKGNLGEAVMWHRKAADKDYEYSIRWIEAHKTEIKKAGL